MAKKKIDFEFYLVHVDRDKCVDGCEECKLYCPCDVFDISHKAFPVRPRSCLGCGTCLAVCKPNAIIITAI